LKNLHNPEVSGSNPDLATKPLNKVERLFSFKAASQARLCKLTRTKKAKQQTKFVVWKALGKATYEDDNAQHWQSHYGSNWQH
jgi:hypothetical protein